MALNPPVAARIFWNKILNIFRVYIRKDKFSIAANRWFRDNGDKTLRLDYPLTTESVVFDLGGYKGDFAFDINSKYGCNVLVFEPVKEFYLECLKRFEYNPKIKVFNYGLSDSSGSFNISNEDNGSSLIKNNTGNCESVFVKSFADEMRALKISNIDLLKINVEGAEFLILPHLAHHNLINQIRYIQVQFHTFYPESSILRDRIRETLSLTHKEMWNYHFVWESWERR